VSVSCVLILPANQVAIGNAVGEAMGWGPDNYSVALSADGSEPATHWGLHAWAADSFQTLVESGIYPPELAEAGISEADYDAMMAVLIFSFQADITGHFDAVCEANGLQMVEAQDATE
jgi:hypothetical protein